MKIEKTLFGDPTGKIKTFAILSVENPLGAKDYTDEAFEKKYALWKKDKSKHSRANASAVQKALLQKRIEQTGDDCLRYGAFPYARIESACGEKEKALVVCNINEQDAIEIARSYGQERFFYGETATAKNGTPISNIACYETSDCCQTYRVADRVHSITTCEEATAFFSSYGWHWRVQPAECRDAVPTVKNATELEESLSEDRTFLSRARHRRDAYRG